MDSNDICRAAKSIAVGYGALETQAKELESKIAELGLCYPAQCPPTRAAAAAIVGRASEMIGTLRSIIAFAASIND